MKKIKGRRGRRYSDLNSSATENRLLNWMRFDIEAKIPEAERLSYIQSLIKEFE